MLQLLLYLASRAEIILESSFLQTNCLGPPQVMYAFNISDLTSAEPAQGEVWPPMYSLISQYFVYGTCGCLFVEPRGSCCYRIVGDALGKYHSGASQLIDSVQKASPGIPKTVNGKQYCYLLPDSTNTGVFGYQSAYYLADGSCVDQVQCLPDGQLVLFSDSECTKVGESFSLTNQPALLSSNLTGNVLAQLLTVQDASIWFSFVTSTPGRLVTPEFNHPANIMSLLAYLTCVVLTIGNMVNGTKKFIQRKKNMDAFIVVNMFLWLLATIFNFCFWVLTFSDVQTMGIFSEIRSLSYNLASLTSLYIGSLMLQVAVRNFWYRVGIYIVLGVLHLVLAGEYYIDYFTADNYANLAIADFATQWYTLYPFWICVMLLFNAIPSVYTVIMLKAVKVASHSGSSSFSVIRQDDPWLIPCVVAQCAVFLFYVMLR